MDILMIVLRLVHIVGGVLWAGWAFVLPLFVEPASRIAGPQAAPFMQALTGKTRLVQVMTFTPLLVILSGLWLLWKVSGGFSGAYLTSVHGLTLLTAAVLGILGFIYGILMVRPLGIRMGQIGQEIATSGQPPTAEHLQELSLIRDRMRVRGRTIGWIILTSVAGMAVSRYVV